MKLNKFLVTLVVIILCVGCFALVGCKKKEAQPSGDNYPVVQDTAKVNVYIANEVITTQQEFDQNGTFAKYSCEYDSIKNAEEGLLTFFDMQDPKIEYTFNGSYYEKVGSIVISDTEKNSSDIYRITVFTTIKADQDTTASAKIIKYGNYTLVNTNKAYDELTFEEGCLYVIAKVKY